MPYNISKACVHRMRRYLDEMVVERRTLTFPTHEPKQLSYKIREAIFAARRYPEFSIYHPLHHDYRMRPRTGWVEAEYIGAPRELTLSSPTAALTISEVSDLHEVVGACIKFGARSEEIHFPSVRLSSAELLALFEWGKKEGWALISHDDRGVTVTRKKNVDKLFLWEPGVKDE